MDECTPVKVIYRSKGVSLPLLAAMRACDAWTEAGLDPGPDIPFVSGAAQSDPMLESGEVDFIFGSHVTPYLRYDDGAPFVCLGQSVNWVDDVVVTASPIADLSDLRGQRIADPLTGHPHGNHVLYLRRAGVDEDEVVWVECNRRSLIDAVVSGEADAAFMVPPELTEAARELAVHRPPRLPMVMATTVTTLWPTLERAPDLCRRVLRAVRRGVKYFKAEPDVMRDVIKNEAGPALGISDPDTLDLLYARNAGLLESTLYPLPESIANAFQLAVRSRPGIEARVNPLALWDLHLLRELDAEQAA